MTDKSAYYSGSPFEELAGYARAIRHGQLIAVSGTAGYDFKTGHISEDPAEQAQQALATIQSVLEQAGAGLNDVIRVVVYLSDRAWIQAVSSVLKESFPEGLITNTTVICTLTMPEMKVELEVTAVAQ